MSAQHHRAGTTRRRCSAAVAVAALITTFFAITNAPTAAANPEQHDILGFGDTLEPTITAGANQVIRATGTISNTTLCGPGGTNDFVYPAADVYLVEAGSVSSGGGALTEAGGGAASTIVSATAGGYIDEILGITGPGGTLGQGSYDVVVDECQDGRFDPGVDSIFPDAVTVAFPPKIPPYTGYIGDIKARAATTALHWLYASIALDAVRGELGLGDLSNVENDNPDTSTIQQLLDKIIGWIAIAKDPASLLPSGGPWDVIGSGVNAALNEVKHYDAIAADPPESDYKHPVTLPKIDTTPPTSPDAPVAAIEAMTAPAQAENAISAAFLTALERYQGARLAGDAGWALTHAREVASLARLLASAQARSGAAATAMSDALAALPGFTALHQQTHDLGARIQTKGFTGAEIRALRNLGYSTADIEQFRAALPPLMECNGCWYAGNEFGAPPPYQNTVPGLQAALTDLATAESDAAASSTALAERVDGVVSELAAQSSVPQTAPVADAGGPYTAGTRITLDASGSTPGNGETITSYAWDTDGDGSFDDATGARPTVTLPVDSPGVVGVEVTGSDGQSAIDYASVAVQAPTPPSIADRSPAGRSVTVTVGAPVSFSTTGHGGTATWSLDGTAIPGVTGDTYTLTPTTDQIGPHQLALTRTASDGQHTSVDWFVSVLAADADGDGWTATPDCDDQDALVNPGRPEVIGNGVDDDCDPATSDTPLADYTGQAMSWGSDQSAILGRSVGTGTAADTPSNITGLGSVAQLAAGVDLGLALDTDGAVWSWGTGSGNSWNDPAPVGVPSLTGSGQLGRSGPKATAVVSDRQSAALLADGTVAAWGDNGNGALGTGSAATSGSVPALVEAPAGSALRGVTEIAAGGNFLALATGNGALYVTGGVCGTPDGTTAQHVDGMPGKVIAIAAGTGHLLILVDGGELYGCGANDHGQLGAGPASVGAPQQITLPAGMARPAQLAAGNGFSLVLDTDGAVWAFGRDDNGQLGDGGTDDTSTPAKIALPSGATITQLAAGGDSAAIVRADGSILQWGHGTTGPSEFDLPDGVRVAHLALDTAGSARYAIATRADAVIGWGVFAGGSGGPGSPGGAPGVLDLPGLRDIATTGWDSVGITADGSVLSWGNGGDELGGGNSRKGGPVPRPVLDTGGAPGSQLHARSVQGFNQAFDAVLDNGTAAVWGDWTGMWQDPGVHDSQYFPVLIPDSGGTAPITNVTQTMLNLGGARFLLRSDGTVWAWWGDGPEQCRPGAPEATYLPQHVTALGADNKQVAAAQQGAGLFLKTDGSLWSCGEGAAPVGRVIPGGNDPAHEDANPGQVQGMGPGSVAQVSAGREQALALKTDGTVWAWGRNDDCSVVCTEPDYSDDNTMIDFPVQVPIPAGAPIVSVTACDSASYAIRADGTVLAWGSDMNGSLGVTDPDAIVSPPDRYSFVPEPSAVPMPGNRPVWKIACGDVSGPRGGLTGLALVGDPVAHLADPDQLGIGASAADTSVTEGDTATVTVSLSHRSGLDLTVHYATSDGTAAGGTDYTASSGTVTIPAGKTSGTIRVPTAGNDETQPSRAFTVTISDPSTSYGPAPWASIKDATATVTIDDDDPASVVSIAGPSAPVVEGNTGGTVVPFTISLNHPSASTVSVDWATADGTATAPGDYLPGHGTATFAPGRRTSTVDVVVNGDTSVEADEAFTVGLSDPAGAALGPATSAQASITDDDPVVVTTGDADTAAPGGSGATTADFTITAPHIPDGETVTVPWHVAPGTTGAGQVRGSGTVTLTAAHPSATATVQIAAGSYAHTSRYQLRLDGPTDSIGRTVLARGGTGTITVTDVPPTVSPVADRQLLAGATLHVSGTFTDPDPADTWTGTVDYGSGAGAHPLALHGKAFSLEHTYPDPGRFSAVVTVCDGHARCGSATFTVTVLAVTSSCRARALALDGTRPIQFGVANPAQTPCTSDTAQTPSASITLVPGIPLLRIPPVAVSVTALTGATAATRTGTAVTASAALGTVSITALGLRIQLTALRSQVSATAHDGCTVATSGTSSVGELVVNGKHYPIGSAPFTLRLPLGLELRLNQQVTDGGTITRRALYLSGPSTVYDTALGEAAAGLSC